MSKYNIYAVQGLPKTVKAEYINPLPPSDAIRKQEKIF